MSDLPVGDSDELAPEDEEEDPGEELVIEAEPDDPTALDPDQGDAQADPATRGEEDGQ